MTQPGGDLLHEAEVAARIDGDPHVRPAQPDGRGHHDRAESISLALDERRDVLAIVRASQLRRTVFWREVAVVAMEGELIAAADVVSQTGAVTVESQLRFRGGQQLIAEGRHAEGAVELERALEFYRSVDASAYVAQIESALARSHSESA